LILFLSNRPFTSIESNRGPLSSFDSHQGLGLGSGGSSNSNSNSSSSSSSTTENIRTNRQGIDKSDSTNISNNNNNKNNSINNNSSSIDSRNNSNCKSSSSSSVAPDLSASTKSSLFEQFLLILNVVLAICIIITLTIAIYTTFVVNEHWRKNIKTFMGDLRNTIGGQMENNIYSSNDNNIPGGAGSHDEI
jgi:hypothetical protein